MHLTKHLTLEDEFTFKDQFSTSVFNSGEHPIEFFMVG